MNYYSDGTHICFVHTYLVLLRWIYIWWTLFQCSFASIVAVSHARFARKNKASFANVLQRTILSQCFRIPGFHCIPPGVIDISRLRRYWNCLNYDYQPINPKEGESIGHLLTRALKSLVKQSLSSFRPKEHDLFCKRSTADDFIDVRRIPGFHCIPPRVIDISRLRRYCNCLNCDYQLISPNGGESIIKTRY